MNKKQINLLNNYKRATTTTLNELYKNASYYKWQAYCKILEKARQENGNNIKCFNANCNTFSMAYTTIEQGKTYLNYYTAYNFYKFCITE